MDTINTIVDFDLKTDVSVAAGCENGCSGHGQCMLEEGLYKCVCIQGWAGSDCSIPLEQDCQDDIDNDHGKKLFSLLYENREHTPCRSNSKTLSFN